MTASLIAFNIFGMGPQELLIIAIIGLLLFGATRLPDLGRSFGKTITAFRQGMSGSEEGVESPSNPQQTTKVEPEPLKAPPRLTTPSFNSERSETPKA
jgi:sec-independent protein translocase protein TatA